MILSEVHVDVGALIATAGIAGLAIGFGAQTLVKDVISGVFLLFDDTIHVGDLIRIGNDVGTVEEIGLRLIRVRKFDGELMMIPAGELRTFGNKSIGYVRVIVEIGLSYEQDLDTLLPVIERIAHEWATEHQDILLEESPQVQSVMSFGESSVNVRVVAQVVPGEQFQAERDLRLKLKQEFDRIGIEIPFPRRTIYMRQEESAPSRTVQDDVSPPDRPTTEPPEGSD
jgi:small conductance mechanosensitive channel